MFNKKLKSNIQKTIHVSLLVIIAVVNLAACKSAPRQQTLPPKPPTSSPIQTEALPEGETLMPATGTSRAADAPEIFDISTNAGTYSGGTVPRYSKFEVTFQINTSAQNLQMPFDANPPPGITPGMGVSVDAQFSPDNWQTVYTQPAFYYQEFDDQVKSGREWFYPTGGFSWKARFSPNRDGPWQYRLMVEDAGGRTETAPETFTVTPSRSPGFVRVSQRDSRYFEFEDGTYFPALGYNMNFNHLDWSNPVLSNQRNFQAMSENGIQLVRMWLSQWGIYSSAWSPWNSIDPDLHALYVPFGGVEMGVVYPGSEVSMRIDTSENPCMFIGWVKAPPAVKRSTNYRIRVRYKTDNVGAAVQAGKPSGLVGKVGGWLWDGGNNCNVSGTGSVVTAYQSKSTSDWQILEGSINTGQNDFLPYFYLVMENVNAGLAYVDHVWIEEDQGSGQFGPNIVSKPSMAQHLYMEQRNSYAFDKVLDLAAQYNIYLRPVVLEKNETILQSFNFDGATIPANILCRDNISTNDPAQCPGNKWFYGDWRSMTKTRWLQQSWWRYLQARWGYSTSIHSWELLNEGDPFNGNHYALADEFGKYMHQFQPNHHLVSTSFWHSFPKNEFWANADYPDIDFADIHQYVSENTAQYTDTALATYEVSMQYGARRPGGAGKPVIRGETGFVIEGSGPASAQIRQDSRAVWLHNYIWGGINAGGMIESYWYDTEHIYRHNNDGTYAFDYRSQYRTFYNFIRGIPLSNGQYQDAQPQVSDTRLRAWGQKDLTNQQAHLWIQNTQHTWQNDMNNITPAQVSTTVRMQGFAANTPYRVEWFDTYQTDPGRQLLRRETVTTGADGTLTLNVSSINTDIAVKVRPDPGKPSVWLPSVITQ